MSLHKFDLFNGSLINIESIVDIETLITQIEPHSTTPINLREILSQDGVEITVVLCLNGSNQNNENDNGVNPLAIAGVSCLGVALAAPVIVPLALGAAGFGAAGVAAGSAAAVWQASIGNVAAGSVFAGLTSAGAGGAGLGVVTGGLASGGAIAGSSFLALNAQRRGGDSEDNGGNEDDRDMGSEQRAVDAKLAVLVRPMEEADEEPEIAAGGELRFRTQTTAQSTVVFYVNRTGASA